MRVIEFKNRKQSSTNKPMCSGVRIEAVSTYTIYGVVKATVGLRFSLLFVQNEVIVDRFTKATNWFMVQTFTFIADNLLLISNFVPI